MTCWQVSWYLKTCLHRTLGIFDRTDQSMSKAVGKSSYIHILFCKFSEILSNWTKNHKKKNKQTNTHIESSPLSENAANDDLCLALMSIELWGFFSVPRLLWHGTSVFNGHLRGPVTLTPAERLAMVLSLPAFTTYVCRGWDLNTQPSTCAVWTL